MRLLTEKADLYFFSLSIILLLIEGIGARICLSLLVSKTEPPRGKTNVAVSDQVRHKPYYTVQKTARTVKFRIKVVEGLTIRVAKTKALISFAVTAKLICAFVFAYENC